MKEKVNYYKDKIISFFTESKNKIVPLIIRNKKISIAVLAIIIIAILIACIVPTKKEIGSTNGNLENSGFSVNIGKWTYYFGYNQGSADGIYKIKGNKKQKVNDDYAIYLNKSGKYIYYLDAKEDSIVRVKINGKDKETIVKNVDKATVTVTDDWIYYFDNSSFYRVKTNGENKKIISKKFIENYQVVGDWIYFSYMSDGNYVISKMKNDGENVSKIDAQAGKSFYVSGKNIYYINKNYDEEKYELYKIKTNGKGKNKIADINETVDLSNINFNENEVYYTKKNESLEMAIYKMDLKGKKETKVVDVNGYTTSINIQNDWIYYPDQDKSGNVQMFRIKTDGSDKQGL